MPTGPKGEKRPADVIGNAVKRSKARSTPMSLRHASQALRRFVR
jgi:hypothetical protein